METGYYVKCVGLTPIALLTNVNCVGLTPISFSTPFAHYMAPLTSLSFSQG